MQNGINIGSITFRQLEIRVMVKQLVFRQNFQFVVYLQRPVTFSVSVILFRNYIHVDVKNLRLQSDTELCLVTCPVLCSFLQVCLTHILPRESNQCFEFFSVSWYNSYFCPFLLTGSSNTVTHIYISIGFSRQRYAGVSSQVHGKTSKDVSKKGVMVQKQGR